MSAANPVTLPLSGYRGRRVNFAVDGKVATLTLNRPHKKNPLTFDSYAEIVDLFRAAAKDKGVKAIVNIRFTDQQPVNSWQRQAAQANHRGDSWKCHGDASHLRLLWRPGHSERRIGRRT